MALTDEQIQALFAFTKKKLVHYYDLQVELVDHLAASIEEEIENDPTLSFEIALQKVYARFGIFGFAKVVQEKQKALSQLGARLFWQAVKNLFQLPKIFMTISVFLSAYYLGQYLSPSVRGVITIAFTFTLFSAFIYTIIKNKPAKGKKLLLLEAPNTYSFTGFYPFYVLIRYEYSSVLAFAILLLIVFIIEMALIDINRNLVQQAKEQYPEAYA